MITANEANKLSQYNTLSSRLSETLRKLLPEIEEVVQTAVDNGLFEVDWDCSKTLDLVDDAKDLVKLQVYLQSLGYTANITVPRVNYDDDDYDYFYINISWENA